MTRIFTALVLAGFTGIAATAAAGGDYKAAAASVLLGIANTVIFL